MSWKSSAALNKYLDERDRDDRAAARKARKMTNEQLICAALAALLDAANIKVNLQRELRKRAKGIEALL